MPAFRHRLRVRYHECDAQARVFNAHYFAYFDIAVTELWREAFGSYDTLVERGYDVVVAEASARFRRPAGFDEWLDIALEIASLEGSDLITNATVLREETVIVEGRLHHVFVSTDTMRRADPPGEVTARLKPWMARDAPPDPGT